MFKRPHWTLSGYEVCREAVPPRSGVHIHTFGMRGDLVDDRGHFRNAYVLAPGDWALVRPDGYIGAIVSSKHLGELKSYLSHVGLGAEGWAFTDT